MARQLKLFAEFFHCAGLDDEGEDAIGGVLRRIHEAVLSAGL